MDIDRNNIAFWNELCGTRRAMSLGINDGSPESIQKFDAHFFEYYPYLLSHVELSRLSGKKVLEVGLGYGSLGQKIAEQGADYVGLDIAEGPVNMMTQRLRHNDLKGTVVQGSMLQCPFADATFDAVVSIGCFHHTGDIQHCFNETYRVLRPGGSALVMIYNQFSYLHWNKWPVHTFKYWLHMRGWLTNRPVVTAKQRKVYDENCAGQGAPETVFSTTKQVRRYCRAFSQVDIKKEECGNIRLLGPIILPRQQGLSTIGRWLGTYLYCSAIK